MYLQIELTELHVYLNMLNETYTSITSILVFSYRDQVFQRLAGTCIT